MVQSFLLLGLAIIATASAHLLLKKGMLIVGQLDFSLSNSINLLAQIFQILYLFFGLISFGLAFFFWLFVLSKLQLNIAYPIITSLNFCLVIVGSWFFFREELSIIQILGVGLIILGIFFLLKP